MATPEPRDLTLPEGKLAQDYLADKACQLRNHAIEFERAAEAAGPPSRTARVLATVAARGRSYRAVQLLHTALAGRASEQAR